MTSSCCSSRIMDKKLEEKFESLKKNRKLEQEINLFLEKHTECYSIDIY
jgi:hypothetical protein